MRAVHRLCGSIRTVDPGRRRHWVVPAFVDGKGTAPSILDSGADGSAVYDWFAKQQRLAAGTATGVEGMTGAAMMATYRLASLTLDGRTIHAVKATGLPDRNDAAISAGVAGNDVIGGAIVTFVYPCRTVMLTPKLVSMLKPISSGP